MRTRNKTFLITTHQTYIPFSIQTTCQTTTTTPSHNTIESNKNNVNKKVTTEDDYVYVSDYLKRIRQVENFDHYSFPHANTFMGGGGAVPHHPLYPDYAVDAYNPYNPYHTDLDYAYGPPAPPPLPNFRELMQTTEFPSGLSENGNGESPNEEVKGPEQLITFRYAGMKQQNYSLSTTTQVQAGSLHLIDVDYENDVYFLHHKVILRANLGENGIQFVRVAVIDDVHEEITEAHVS